VAQALAVALVACAAAAAVVLADAVPVKVSPTHGSVHKTFIVRFTSQESLGVNGVAYSDYRVVVTGPQSAASCTNRAEATIDHGAAGARVRISLAPRSGGRWCAGRFGGALFYEHGPYCPSGHTGPCPMFPSTVTQVGQFEFRVGR
jgi:hypothetical protein